MPKQCTSDIRRFVQQWWVAFHDLSGEVVRWKYSFHWRMERSQITLDLDRFYPSESFGELHYCTVLPPFQTPGPRSFIWTTVLSRPLSCATVKSKAGDGDTLRFGVAKWPQESVRCRKPCASWRINMNQLINYLSARAGFRRKEFNGINGYEKSIKRHSSKTLAMQPFRNSVYLSRSLLLFFWYSCMWRCDALFGSYKIHPPKPILMKCDRPQRKFHTVALWQSGPSELHPESWNTWMEKRGFQGECCESTKLRSWGS